MAARSYAVSTVPGAQGGRCDPEPASDRGHRQGGFFTADPRSHSTQYPGRPGRGQPERKVPLTHPGDA
ncbi:hypothetical protein C791_1202 [Amycolatopsis azurea DSM 43854]|uniref:Uncharacterized protein n=1 Tax=Amycolatopsis azurea DSM 43854 TaxID=1238180 RepID=M2Q8L3_9PSEU|nr:hypothetical protein C791_1202 [Amycolatopsis azurea DSM 43854]